MALLTEKFYINLPEKIFYKVSISVGKDGLFATTLPPEIVELFDVAGIQLGRNRMNNPGYFVDNNLKSLCGQIKEANDKIASRKLIESKMIIQYSIWSAASYCVNSLDEFVPNGSPEWEPNKETLDKRYTGLNWKQGNINIHSSASSSFGIQIYARVMEKNTFEFYDKKTVVEYNSRPYLEKEASPNAYWINSIPCLDTPKSTWGQNSSPIEEMDYNETNAAFFKGMLVWIMKLTDQIKDFLKPSELQSLIESKTNIFLN